MNKLVIAIVSVFLSAQATAGFLVEPYVGYGQIATTTDVSAVEDEDAVGSFLGGRLGYSFLLVSGGIDFNTGSAGDFERTNTSAFVGVDLPILLRFYAKYLVSSNLEHSDHDFDYNLKDGYALGAGFTGLPFVVLNLEMAKQVYEVETDGQSYDVDGASYLLSVSLPLDL